LPTTIRASCRPRPDPVRAPRRKDRFFITIWRPFHLGDNVELLPENLKGRVIDRNLMFTVLSEDSGATLLVANNLFFQKIFRVSR
jgi:small-conductance mechanosensitive channel